MLPESAATVAAYQRLQLLEIRGLYDELDFDLNHYLGFERDVEKKIDSLEGEFAEIRRTLASLGADPPHPDSDLGDLEIATTHSPSPQSKRYKKIHVANTNDFRGLVKQAEGYLTNTDLDLNKDPLLQILGPGEAASITKSYRNRYGDIGWDRSDYLIVTLAGFVATLLDVFLVRIPLDTNFLGEMQQGSPMTKWLKENSEYIHERYLKRFEELAKVPYDDPINGAVPGLSPKLHRLMSPGHDPVLGFIFGVIDIMGGMGTFIDKHGDVIRIDKPVSPEGLMTAFLKVFLHLLSDVCTSAGVPPPFFTLLQLVKAKSPFVLGPSGERVSWTNVARYMYGHGYDLRHFATMGIVPAAVEMIIRGWWLCRSFEDKDEAKLAKVKLTSMLLLGHTIATSGNLLKTGVIYSMSPLALNWAEMMRLLPVTISWIKESSKRNLLIRDKLDAEWISIYQTNLRHSR